MIKAEWFSAMRRIEPTGMRDRKVRPDIKSLTDSSGNLQKKESVNND